MPLYFRQLAEVSPVEILAHRAWWSCVLTTLIVIGARRLPVARAVLGDRRTLMLLLASTLFIGANWLTYIYAVSSRQVVQAGLGYFITPLANVLLGVVVLGERLRRLQVLAVGVATLGVLVLSIYGGTVPWVALSLALSFSLYGLLRKLAQVEALAGLFIETALLAPVALVYLAQLALSGEGVFAWGTTRLDAWLMASGPVTAAPLLCFTAAARRLPLNTMGFLQFITPSLQMGVAIWLFREPFTTAHRWTFSLIWTAVAIYLVDAVWGRKSRQREVGSRQ